MTRVLYAWWEVGGKWMVYEHVAIYEWQGSGMKTYQSKAWFLMWFIIQRQER